MPHAFSSSTALLGQLVGDNHTLAHLVQTSDGWLRQFAAQRSSLGRMVDVVGQTGATLAERRTQLRQTLADAPGTLRTLQTFLAKLQATTVPLGPAARDISSTAPELSATLAQVDPFRVAADPALNAATSVAPDLTTLATKATPVLDRAVPVAHDLASFSTSLTPVSDALNHSIDNLLAIMQNWSRAIQFRDGLSHVFRGEASFTPDSITTFIDRLMAATSKSSKHSTASRSAKPSAAKPQASTPATPAPAATQPKSSPLTQPLQKATGQVQQSVQSLLNYLIHP
jgi:phospholipid/cholesterol/gamma-HCH transport system substrate-binding protein